MKSFDGGRLMPALFAFLAGCAGVPDAARYLSPGAAATELVDTPFYAQSRYQCGPAALATILEASGANITLDDIVRKVYIPERKGSLQTEILAATRTSGRLPYLVDGSLASLLRELDSGRPVLVLQNLGVAAIPRWHYAVVVGIDPEHGIVVLRSGVEHRRVTPINLFLRTWSRSNYWGLVALRPGQLPANVDRDRYFAAVAGLEHAGRAGDALLGWEAALQRWPQHPTALFGLANTRLALGDSEGAVNAYRELLDLVPILAPARNNLAIALARQQRFDEAMNQIELALSSTDDPDLIRTLSETTIEIRSMRESAPRAEQGPDLP